MIGASMNGPMSANSMMLGGERAHRRAVDAHERAGEPDVLATGQVLVEARAQRQQARDAAVDLDRARRTA